MTRAGLRFDRVTEAVSTETKRTPFSRGGTHQMTQVYDELHLNPPQAITRSAEPVCRTNAHSTRDSQPNALPATRTPVHPLLYALPRPESGRHTARAARLENH
jgi:hypothetical protein